MKPMNLNTRTTVRRRRFGLLAAAMGLAFAVPAAHAEAEADARAGAFEMVVYSDSAQGKRLIEGDYDEALAMSEAVNATRFESLNNRCVSLTVSGELSKAEVVCDSAVRAARRSAAAYAGRYSPHGVAGDVRTNRAMAFTNRGVLRALQGDRAGAREDFETAVDLSSRVKAAATNLVKLEAIPAVAIMD